MVAAKDWPAEFKVKRGKIAEKLYSCQFSGISGCACVEAGKNGGGNGDVSEADGAEHERALTQNRNDRKGKGKAMAMEDDGDNEIVGEVLKIKELITSCQNEVCPVQFFFCSFKSRLWVFC